MNDLGVYVSGPGVYVSDPGVYVSGLHVVCLSICGP